VQYNNLCCVNETTNRVRVHLVVHKPSGPFVEPITEERANRCLARIDLLCKIREQILHNPLLDDRIGLCQPSGDMPEWWVCGVHDRDLLVGAAR